MTQVNIAIVGLGAFGLWHLKTLLNIPQCCLAAVCDSNAELARQTAEPLGIPATDDVRSLLDDEGIAALVLAIPPFAGAEIAAEALQAGKHVFIEKPIAVDYAAACKLQCLSETSGRTLMVGYVERFNPSLRRTRALIRSGAVGNVIKLSSRRASRYEGKPDWVWDRCGIVVHVVGHDLDLMRWFMDDDVVRVYAESGWLRRDVEGQPDTVCATLRFRSGAIGVIESSWTLPSTHPAEENDTRMDITGTTGVISVDNLDQTIHLCSEEAGYRLPSILRWPGGLDGDVGPLSWALKDELIHFVSCIRGDAEPPASAEHACETLRILLAINKATRTGSPINLDSFQP